VCARPRRARSGRSVATAIGMSPEEANAARNARATAFFAAQQQRSGESDSDEIL